MLASEATIPATDEGLIRGDGVFEVIRLYDGRPFALDRHLARLERSATNLRLPLDVEAVRADAWRLLAQAGVGPDHELLRIMVTRGGRRLLLTEPMVQTPEHVRLASVTYAPTRILDGIKSLSYGANMLAGRLARERGFDEALLVTPHGRVLEAPTSSIFYVKDGELLDAAARRAHPRLDHPRDRDRGHGRGRALVHARRTARSGRGVPGLDDARGAAGLRDRRPDVRRARTGHGADGRVGRGAGSPAAGRRDERAGRRHSMKVLTVIGNRPQFIKAAAVSPRLRARHQELLIHTGQHFDDDLSTVFFAELGLPAPDRSSGSRSGRTAPRPRGCWPRSSRWSPRRSRMRCSSTATRTRRSPARSPAPRPVSRSRTSRRGCARSTARCPRS